MDLYHQINVLTVKTLKIILLRHRTSTLYSALILPVIASIYLGLGQNFGQPNDKFGIGSAHEIISFGDALANAGGGRNTVLFIKSTTNSSSGDIDRVIDTLADQVTKAGKNATRLDSEDDIGFVCKSSIRGTSSCFGAVVFHESPDGNKGHWNYTLRADSGLANTFKVDKDDNDAQKFVLPLQHAVDLAIAKIDSSSSSSSSSGAASGSGEIDEYPITSISEKERADEVRRKYQSSFINYLSVAFIIALIGVCYHMPGFIATERENGLSQLIEAMMPVRRGWHSQLARLLSYHIAFSATYLPGWIVASVIVQTTIWKHTSIGILIVFFILSGLAMTSMSLLGACFFKKAQLSGIITAVVWLALGIVAQAVPHVSTATVVALSLLFTPCNFVYFIINMARYEREGRATNLLRAYDDGRWQLPGYVLWIFLVAQTLIYPFLAAFLERALHGVTTGTRSQSRSSSKEATANLEDAVAIQGLTKVYQASFLRRLFSFMRRPPPKVVAVDSLNLTAKKGQILALLGANGSGKSTTLDAIAGISNYSSGSLAVDASGGLGIAPQKNVLWDDLTVFEHVKLFNRLKAPSHTASDDELMDLIDAIGLQPKTKALAGTLSGGQKRKLQLGLMLTGGSAVCCVDEVSSGIDPLSRRKIWDILLAERGKRTIIMTTHFLDEADLLADKIAILSKGSLRAEGSAAQLKDTYGAGYRVHVLNARQMIHLVPEVQGVTRNIASNTITYVAPSSQLAAQVIQALEHAKIPYKLASPTIEDVFLNLADEVRDQEKQAGPGSGTPIRRDVSPLSHDSGFSSEQKVAPEEMPLLPGRQISMPGQVAVLLRKRVTIFKTNWIPYLAGFVIPIIAAGITQLLVKNESATGCRPQEKGEVKISEDYQKLINSPFLVAGPGARVRDANVGQALAATLTSQRADGQDGRLNIGDTEITIGNLTVKLVQSYGDFKTTVEDNRRDIMPAGLWLGDGSSKPTLAYRANNYSSMYTAVLGQSLLQSMLSNVTIASSYRPFSSGLPSNTGKGLQLIVYFAVACSVVPGLFALYPSTEKRRSIRALQYSSGARALPVWAAHLLFDISIIVVSMAMAVAIFAATSDAWYHVGYLFPVFVFYGCASLQIGYFLSLWLKSGLATYAMTAVVSGVGFAIYLISFLFILTYSDPVKTDDNILISHWVISVVFPTGSLVRALMVGLNVFSTTCTGFELQSNPGAMTAYGGPILYLVLQSVFWFSMVVWFESSDGKFQTGTPRLLEDSDDPEVAAEAVRVDNPGDDAQGLRVAHLTKAFNDTTAVDNVTFGVDHGQVFALLGPNGAGKSTTISLIRGDIAPSKNGGDVFIENKSVTKQRPLARANLGVCPQFDAIDSMTVQEHLLHYAHLRGIEHVDYQVRAVIQAVGLDAYAQVMAHTLSGGNKRKLSLAIALTGNPSVILLDEPSSGLDAAAKRIMWRTLESIVPGRSILLTTHSMEEADALANRAGIMAKRMLALGTTDDLNRRFGDALHIHLVSKTAPHTTPQEIAHIRSWIQEKFPGAQVEQATFHGQMRFAIPASSVPNTRQHLEHSHPHGREKSSPIPDDVNLSSTNTSAIGQLLIILEEHKEELGIAHHSVSPTTLNEVFLAIVGKHDVQEEGYGEENKPWYKKDLFDFGSGGPSEKMLKARRARLAEEQGARRN